MLAQRTEQWEKIEKISQQMRNLAASVQASSSASNTDEFSEHIWHEINELNIKKKQFLEDFFKISVSTEEASFLHKHIKKIMSLDKELNQTIETIKRHLGCRFSELDNQQRAAVAYHRIQSS